MRPISLKIVICVALLSCVSAFADSIVGSSGAGWQTWALTAIQGSSYGTGTPYWNGNSSDYANGNVGDCLAGYGGNCVIPGAPGVLPYWGMTGGAADESFYFNASSPSSNAALEIEVAGNAGINSFGWYDTNDLSVFGTIFTGPQGAGATNTFTPTANYGFWFTGADGTYYTQSSSLGVDQGNQHFAVFQQNSSTYWLGMEDLNYSHSDKDFQDMVVKISAVPDGGVTLMLLGGALVGLATLRRRFRA